MASSVEKLAKDEGDLWDSGKVVSDQSIHVPYVGRELTSRLPCFWKVRIDDKDGKVPTSGAAREVTTQAVSNYKNSEKDDLTYLVDLGKFPFATCDGLHPTAAGHQAIYETALPAFDAILRKA